MTSERSVDNPVSSSLEQIIKHKGVASLILETRLNSFAPEDQQTAINLITERENFASEISKMNQCPENYTKKELELAHFNYIQSEIKIDALQQKYPLRR